MPRGRGRERKQKRDIKQNLQSFGFSSRDFDCKKEKKYYEKCKETIDGLPCLNNRISPVLSRNLRL